MPNLFATISMIRMFAWCRSSQSTSSTVKSAASKASFKTTGTSRVANLYTSCPFIFSLPYFPELRTFPSPGVDKKRDSPTYLKCKDKITRVNDAHCAALTVHHHHHHHHQDLRAVQFLVSIPVGMGRVTQQPSIIYVGGFEHHCPSTISEKDT